MGRLFAEEIMIITSEQVSNGHPDKICDQISDAVLTVCLEQDKNSRVAVETLIKDNHIVVAGEMKTTALFDLKTVVRNVVKPLGMENIIVTNLSVYKVMIFLKVLIQVVLETKG